LEAARRIFHIAIRIRYYEDRRAAEDAAREMMSEATLAALDRYRRDRRAAGR
jgi:hypothetical protein